MAKKCGLGNILFLKFGQKLKKPHHIIAYFDHFLAKTMKFIPKSKTLLIENDFQIYIEM